MQIISIQEILNSIQEILNKFKMQQYNFGLTMDTESLRISAPSPSSPSIWSKLAQILHLPTENIMENSQTPSVCLKTHTLYMKNGLEIDLFELQQAVNKYVSIYNINSTANIMLAGFNQTKVRYFLQAVMELMEYVIGLKDSLHNPFIQSLLTDLVQFYDLHKVLFEEQINCYMRILQTSETLDQLLKVGTLHL